MKSSIRRLFQELERPAKAPLMPQPLALAVVTALYAAGWTGPTEPFAVDVKHAASVCRFEQACEVAEARPITPQAWDYLEAYAHG